MGYKLVILFFFLSFLTSCYSQHSNKSNKIDWRDSLCVSQFIKNSSLCEEISVINDSLDVFVNPRGFCMLLIESVSKQTKEFILIPISKGGTLVTEEHRRWDLKDQIDSISNKFCSNKKQP